MSYEYFGYHFHRVLWEYIIFISLIYFVSPNGLIVVICLWACVSIHVRKGVKVCDIYIEHRFYKLKAVRKIDCLHGIDPYLV